MTPSQNTIQASKKDVPTERYYHAYPGSKYMLPHDDLERQRLLLQHEALKSLFENRLVLAPVSLDENDRVLEIGAGPGFWLMDLAASVDSSVPMIGVDIEPRLFPASAPKNIEFRVESVTNLPSEWNDTFSFIHQRLLIWALQVPQWPQAIQEIFRVLRPGGWVQLAESAPWREGEYADKPYTAKMIAIYRSVAKARNLHADCTDDIPKMLEEAGFVDIQSESQIQVIGKWGGETGEAFARNHSEAVRGMMTPVLEAGGFGHVTSEAEYEELIGGVEKEWDEIHGSMRKDFIITWARKPS
ncbi:S-adenosyl-L-methionine-dependent methyltransferase [Mycena sanguinolenta]|nr:S-adenosyl-L-methionine-dependent methyltransferase [Mycena sanguinolenta]